MAALLAAENIEVLTAEEAERLTQLDAFTVRAPGGMGQAGGGGCLGGAASRQGSAAPRGGELK